MKINDIVDRSRRGPRNGPLLHVLGWSRPRLRTYFWTVSRSRLDPRSAPLLHVLGWSALGCV